jgi:hypothetical protein
MKSRGRQCQKTAGFQQEQFRTDFPEFSDTTRYPDPQ